MLLIAWNFCFQKCIAFDWLEFQLAGKKKKKRIKKRPIGCNFCSRKLILLRRNSLLLIGCNFCSQKFITFDWLEFQLAVKTSSYWLEFLPTLINFIEQKFITYERVGQVNFGSRKKRTNKQTNKNKTKQNKNKTDF